MGGRGARSSLSRISSLPIGKKFSDNDYTKLAKSFSNEKLDKKLLPYQINRINELARNGINKYSHPNITLDDLEKGRTIQHFTDIGSYTNDSVTSFITKKGNNSFSVLNVYSPTSQGTQYANVKRNYIISKKKLDNKGVMKILNRSQIKDTLFFEDKFK